MFLHNRRTYSLTLILILTRVVFSYTLCTLHKISLDLLQSIMSHFTLYSLLLCLALSHNSLTKLKEALCSVDVALILYSFQHVFTFWTFETAK